jgi:cytochrome c peroxidase
MPFYATMPVAESVVRTDVDAGLKHVDFLEAFRAPGTPAGEVALAKIERVLDMGTMPPGRYLLLHWNGALSSDEVAQVRAWVRAARAKHYATGTAAPARATEPVQPVPDRVEADPAKVALGEKLFHDKRLSADDTVSCASCHGLDKGGTDRERYSTGVGGKVGGINSPTVFNAGLAFVQFWDGRAGTLKDQAGGPVNNPIEMASNWPQAVAKLSADAEFRKAFEAVYPDGLKGESIQDAIAEFEKTLVTPDAPFDRWLKGDDKAIDEQARKGYEVFKRQGCVGCHVGQAMGGRTFEVLGLKADYVAARGGETDADKGRFNVTKHAGDMRRFKVPTLRNVAVTWPYLHDGTAKDLETAVAAMAKYQTGAGLSGEETAQVVAFLRSLTGTYKGKPLE